MCNLNSLDTRIVISHNHYKMIPARLRVMYKSISASLDDAMSEAANCKCTQAIGYIEDAKEALDIMMEDFDEDGPEELNFD